MSRKFWNESERDKQNIRLFDKINFMKPFLSVIISVYNEAKNLPLTLIDIRKNLAQADYSYEIIVVDDGSKDATAETTKRFFSLIPELRLLENKKNRGKGWGVRRGMLSAKGKWRLFMDADNATSIDQFNKMIPCFADYQVIIGSRDVKGAKIVVKQPFFRRLFGKLGNLIIQFMFLPGYWDTQCGFKCFSEEAAEKVFKLVKIDRWAFDVEVLVLAKKLGYQIKEIPVVWLDNPRSRVKILDNFRFFKDLIKIRWWLWTKRYDFS